MADEVKLPTEDDIRKLPRWAQVAFAARCARRVQPLFKHYWKDAPQKHIDAVTRAVEFAQCSAAKAAAANADAAAANANACIAAYTAACAATFTVTSKAGYAANAAAKAAYATLATTFADAADAADATYAAADDTYAAAPDVAIAIAADFKVICNAAMAGNWTNNTPVSPKVFGPLWPNGSPPGWPKDEATPTPEPEPTPVVVDDGNRLVLKVQVPEVHSPEQAREIEDGINELINALNKAHIERGAGRLTIDDIKQMLPAFVKEGV